MFDFLIVGAGFSGCVLAERLACESKQRVLLIDKRRHVGGNAYDHHDDAGILIHRYGPHIFHTNNAEVFAYLSRFTAWRPYQHRVLTSVDGQLLPLPINLDTVNRLYGTAFSSDTLAAYLKTVAEPGEPTNGETAVTTKIGKELFEKFFRAYTRKQWGREPSELDPAVTARIPARTNRDDRYFTDRYQAQPAHSYARLFENMLDHPNITLALGAGYGDVRPEVQARATIYTGPIDEYFDHVHGPLPYRSLEFRHETHDADSVLPAATVNHPNDYEYTRVTEWKYLTGQRHARTSLTYEYPRAEGEPYYPIPCRESAEIYNRYKALACARPNLYFAGRLASYRYLNMDQIVAAAFTLYDKIAATLPRL